MRHQIKFDASDWTYKVSIDLSLTLGPQGRFTSAESMHNLGRQKVIHKIFNSEEFGSLGFTLRKKKVMKEGYLLRDFSQFWKSTINSQFGESKYNS